MSKNKNIHYLSSKDDHFYHQVMPVSTLKILLEAWALIRIITFHGDGSGHLLVTTNARKTLKHNVAPIYRS